MLTGEDIDERFKEFVHSLEDGEIIIDAVMFFSAINPERPEGTATYGQAIFGDAPMHRCLGLVEMAKQRLIRDMAQ